MSGKKLDKKSDDGGDNWEDFILINEDDIESPQKRVKSKIIQYICYLYYV
jgi:hypothetical protein